MIIYKNILSQLKDAGYNTTRIRKEKYYLKALYNAYATVIRSQPKHSTLFVLF
ncbi:MAG: hypothetical protein ACLTIG_04645 [Roseburia hominis]